MVPAVIADGEPGRGDLRPRLRVTPDGPTHGEERGGRLAGLEDRDDLLDVRQVPAVVEREGPSFVDRGAVPPDRECVRGGGGSVGDHGGAAARHPVTARRGRGAARRRRRRRSATATLGWPGPPGERRRPDPRARTREPGDLAVVDRRVPSWSTFVPRRPAAIPRRRRWVGEPWSDVLPVRPVARGGWSRVPRVRVRVKHPRVRSAHGPIASRRPRRRPRSHGTMAAPARVHQEVPAVPSCRRPDCRLGADRGGGPGAVGGDGIERHRQADKIELIASENYTYAAVNEAQGCGSPTSTPRACPASATTAAASTLTSRRTSPASGRSPCSRARTTSTSSPTRARRPTWPRTSRSSSPATASWA